MKSGLGNVSSLKYELELSLIEITMCNSFLQLMKLLFNFKLF